MKISLIGAGHLGGAFVRGLVRSGYPVSSIIVSNRDPRKAEDLQQSLGVSIAKTNLEAVNTADCVVLAVKPTAIEAVCREISPVVQARSPVLISMAAIVGIEAIKETLGTPATSVVRAMSNTAIEYNHGITALSACPKTSLQQKKAYEDLFKRLGSAHWVDESLLAPLTTAIGCATAYSFLFMDAMQHAAMTQKIPEALAAQVALEVCAGAAALAKHSGHSFKTLGAGVATEGGVTEYSLRKLPRDAFFKSITAVYDAAQERIDELEATFRRKP
jgi:pyrroline-5-carboxylate reductase